jgi:uncharacterized protein (TIGR03437 family)
LTGNAEASVVVAHRGRRSNPATFAVVRANPTILATNQYGRGNAQAINQDGSANDAQHPAARGSVVTLYATGLGQLEVAEAIEVHVGGHPAQVLSMHPSGTRPGVAEVQIRVPETIEPASFQPVVLHLANTFSAPGVGLAIL